LNRQQCRIDLSADYASLVELEEFISSTCCLPDSVRSRALLIATEYFDNIVAHSRGSASCKVSVAVRPAEPPRIVIRYYTLNFRQMRRADRHTEPHYDFLSRRYRGLGLRMCRNLASSIEYRQGLFKSAIIITL